MPERVCIDGRWYVAEDTIAAPRQPTQAEPWLPMKRLCEEYGVDPHRAYAAQRQGRLDARKPHGAQRGLRCTRGEFVRWMEEDLLVAR